jgi:hypothetical protein
MFSHDRREPARLQQSIHDRPVTALDRRLSHPGPGQA